MRYVYSIYIQQNRKQFQSGVDFIKIGFDKYETNWHFHFRSFRFILNDIRLSMSMCFCFDRGLTSQRHTATPTA